MNPPFFLFDILPLYYISNEGVHEKTTERETKHATSSRATILHTPSEQNVAFFTSFPFFRFLFFTTLTFYVFRSQNTVPHTFPLSPPTIMFDSFLLLSLVQFFRHSRFTFYAKSFASLKILTQNTCVYISLVWRHRTLACILASCGDTRHLRVY